ncbi:MAG TPA: HPr family phosphocarrier protein [Puia sp.]|jgi:phosphotransferase system HPr (HPr) family protein|nr:HPr family phosphocarrier protein [Puia sp.]
MITKDYIIYAPEGIHARPAAALVKLARQFKAEIYLRKGEKTVRLNSLLNLLSVGASGGDTISLLIEGEDEGDAAEALDLFFMELKK